MVDLNKPLSYYNCACAKISAECKIGDKQTVNFSSSERTNFEVDGLFISNFALRPDLRACAVVIGKGLTQFCFLNAEDRICLQGLLVK